MTYVSTPSPGAVPQERRTRRPGTKLIAVLLTVAAGGAIAFGASVVNDVADRAPAVSENPELLKHDNAIDDNFDLGRRTPRGAGGAAGTSTMTNEQFIQMMIDSGRLPQGAIPTGTQPVDTGRSGPR